MPITVGISSTELLEALEEPVSQILEALHAVLEQTPPELMSDISAQGIVLTGGGALLYGLDKLIAERVGIPAYVADEAQSCVAIGTGQALNLLDMMSRTGA